MFLEHPDEPKWLPEAPSTWQIKQTLQAEEWPQIDTVTFHQCVFEAISKKTYEAPAPKLEKLPGAHTGNATQRAMHAQERHA